MGSGERQTILKVKDFDLEAGFRVCFGQEKGLSCGLSFIKIGVLFEKFAVKVAKRKTGPNSVPAFALYDRIQTCLTAWLFRLTRWSLLNWARSRHLDLLQFLIVSLLALADLWQTIFLNSLQPAH